MYAEALETANFRRQTPGSTSCALNLALLPRDTPPAATLLERRIRCASSSPSQHNMAGAPPAAAALYRGWAPLFAQRLPLSGAGLGGAKTRQQAGDDISRLHGSVDFRQRLNGLRLR